MAKLASLLQQRFIKKDKPKMAQLAEKASDGDMTVFSGVFNVGGLGDQEKGELIELLEKYAGDDQESFSSDLKSLISITSEVKAINNQAAILHGERIKKAQAILKKYRDGAFTAWLLTTYGNRQTPYNFLQYYEFHTAMPKALHPQIELMPRQAIYTLASRDGNLAKKEEIVRNYKGETKQQMISLIRTIFPLSETDKRRENVGEMTLKQLRRLATSFEQSTVTLSQKQKKELHKALKELGSLVDVCEIRDEI